MLQRPSHAIQQFTHWIWGVFSWGLHQITQIIVSRVIQINTAHIETSYGKRNIYSTKSNQKESNEDKRKNPTKVTKEEERKLYRKIKLRGFPLVKF